MIILIGFLGFLIFIYSIILHEMAHGFVAEKLGDPTAKISGRLTLNPIPHIDPLLSILFPLLLFFTRSPVIFGAAKPVPIDPYNFRNPRKDLGLVGLAGPATNLSIAIVLSLLARLLSAVLPFNYSVVVNQILSNAVYLNIALGLFNLIPVPPLDGSRVLASVLPPKYGYIFDSIERFGFFIIFFLLLFPNSLFSLPYFIQNISNFIFNLIFPIKLI